MTYNPVEVHIVPVESLSIGAFSAISADGRRVVFTRPDVAPRDLWESVRTAATEDVPESPAHRHYFRADIADWWCEACDTVTDYCQQINPR